MDNKEILDIEEVRQEAAVIEDAFEALNTLDDAGRHRVITYLLEAFGMMQWQD